MTSVRELHDEAMRLAQLTLIARQHGKHKEAQALARSAYQHEREAAFLVPEGESAEPTRSILFRSAASLAYQCGELLAAQRLIAEGLSGYPPAQVEMELKELYEQVNFELELELQSITVEEDELDILLRGKGVGFGTILYDEFIERIEATRMLIIRTVQRLMGREYQSGGRIADKYKAFVPLLHTPRAGSFAITIKLGRTEDQTMPLFIDASRVIEEIITGLELISTENEARLREHIQQDAYYQQFLSMTRNRIAPDGEKIRLIQLTSSTKRVMFTRPRGEIPMPVETPDEDELDEEPEFVQVKGVLDYAKSRRKDEIGLTTEDDEEYTIRVGEGMDDLVVSYWKQLVTVSGFKKGRRTIRLTDIESLE
jgi:hypothetical protein